MRLSAILSIPLFVLYVLLLSCEGQQELPDNCNPINFISLEAENDTIESGTETIITSEAEGDALTYEWTMTLGIIEGSGSSVTYKATPCAIGEIEVTCKVIDECGNSESKSVIILVI
ncbi:MAG: PKD domain-containing protein [Bacteroidales bacterium]|nr:MAG: PKD domain-containing protein [Bacteroidales bacterium]